jgi:hypothetical protein
MSIEHWIPIHGYEGIYEISDFGNARRVAPTGKLTLGDVQQMRKLRDEGMYFRLIAQMFGVTKHAVIVALYYRYTRSPLRLPFRLLKPQRDSHGYATVQLCKQGSRHQYPLHRLVSAHFLGKCPKGFEVNHKNGMKSDARLENLEYVTRSQNACHAHRVLGISNNPRHGEANNTAKLTNREALEIRTLWESGLRGPELGKRFRVDKGTIYSIIHRKSWKHI